MASSEITMPGCVCVRACEQSPPQWSTAAVLPLPRSASRALWPAALEQSTTMRWASQASHVRCGRLSVSFPTVMAYHIRCALHNNPTIAALGINQPHTCDISTRVLRPQRDETAVAAHQTITAQCNDHAVKTQYALDTHARHVIATRKAADDVNIAAKKLSALEGDLSASDRQICELKHQLEAENSKFQQIAQQIPPAMSKCSEARKNLETMQATATRYSERSRVHAMMREELEQKENEAATAASRIYCSFCKQPIQEHVEHTCPFYGTCENKIVSPCNVMFDTLHSFISHVIRDRCTICCLISKTGNNPSEFEIMAVDI